MKDSALIIFARKPESGKVKTRLATALGNEKALEIYRLLLEHTRAVVQNLSCDVHVFLTGKSEDAFWQNCYTHQQEGSHLGEKMHRAFARLFAEGYGKVVIIGSDCPGLSADDIDTAFSALDNDEVVIGPAADGGYYLLGMRKLHTSLFEARDWSHGQVFNRTMADIMKEGLSVHILRTLHDVDEASDVPLEWL